MVFISPSRSCTRLFGNRRHLDRADRDRCGNSTHR
jgi:hypothetical protein